MRLALIGAGPWAARHAATIGAMRGTSLEAVVSTQRAKPTFGARLWCRDTDAVPWARIDAAVIASAAHSHYALTIEMITRGVPVLVEKPLSANAKQARRISDLARRQRQLVMVALVHHYSDAFTTLRRTLAGQRIVRINAAGGNAGPYRKDLSALWDYGPHDVGMVFALLRGTRASDLKMTRLHETRDASGGATTHAEMLAPGDVEIALSFGSAMTQKARWLEVETQSARYRYDDLAADKLTRDANGHVESVPIGNSWPLTRTLEAFCRHVRAHRKQHDSLAVSVESCRLLGRIERALARSANT